MYCIVKMVVEALKKIVENQIFWNFISSIVPIIVMIITLRFEEKKNIKNAEIQKEQLNKQLEEEKILHKQSLELEKKEVRANLLPFLKLERDIKIFQRHGHYCFALKIINIGNGGAFDVCVRYKTDGIDASYLYKIEFLENAEYYHYAGFLFQNVLKVGDYGEFEISLHSYENGKSIQQKNTSGTVLFTIMYKDSLFNIYSQEYMFNYNLTNGIGRVETYLPKMISENQFGTER